MTMLAKFDIRTLLACQLLVSVVFAIVLLAMKWAYRSLRGIGSIAIGFLLGVPGVLLLTLRGSISDFTSIVVANALVLVAYLYFYIGIWRFFQGRGKPHPTAPWIAAATVVVATAIITWFSLVHPDIVPRILAATLGNAVLCALIGIELYRNSDGRTSLRVFSIFMFLHIAINLGRAGFTLWLGTPSNFMQGNATQAFAMIANIAFVSLVGVFFQLMIAGELTQALEHSARHDRLTGTLNRLGIEERLATELDRASRNRHPMSAVLIDIDRFKAINDAGGHAAGDTALRSVAQGISKSLRSYDLLGRYGGDEFLLLLPETGAPHALDVIHRVRTILAQANRAIDPALQPTISIGLAEIEPGDTAATLLARADAALYDAKNAGRNCVRHRSGMRAVATDHPAFAAPFETVGQPAKLTVN